MTASEIRGLCVGVGEKVLGGVFLLLPLVGNFANRGVALLLGVAALSCLPHPFGPGVVRKSGPFLGAGALFALYVVTSSAWSPDPFMSLEMCGAWVGFALAVAVLILAAESLSVEARWRILGFLAFGMVALAVLGGAFLVFKSVLFADATFDQQRTILWIKTTIEKTGGSVASLLIWPLAWSAAISRRPLFRVGVLGGLCVILLSGSSATQLAIACGGVIAGISGFIGSKRMTRPIAIGIFILLTTLPFAARQFDYRHLESMQVLPVVRDLPASALHRLVIYGFTAEKIFERPIFGWGFQSSRVIPGGQEIIKARDVVEKYYPRLPSGEPALLSYMMLMPLHPHNVILQWWLELGAVGALLGGMVFVALLRAIRRWDVPEGLKALAFGQFTTWFVISSLAYGVWQSWWLAASLLAGIATVFLGRRPAGPPGKRGGDNDA